MFPLKEELSCLILDKSFHQPGQVQVGFTQAVKQLVLAINFFFVCVEQTSMNMQTYHETTCLTYT